MMSLSLMSAAKGAGKVGGIKTVLDKESKGKAARGVLKAGAMGGIKKAVPKFKTAL